MEPGCRLCYCSYKEVKVMITKNTIRFKCPIRDVPTKDNVRVSLDVGINFHIGKSEETYEEDTKKFIYNFGPNRLEELLHEETEEGIRDFIKKIKVGRVRDVKTELTTALMQELADKFQVYGVVIEQVNIMNVIIPKELRVCLMETTAYDVLLQKQIKSQENKVLRINNEENKKVLKLKRDNVQALFKF
jgi:regulator of protease activity HflC (stomatin/prohibitin superfamily)